MADWTEQTIGDALVKFINKEFAGAAVDFDTALPKGVLDSLGIFTVVAFVENTFAVSLEDKELTVENFQSVRTLSKMVNEKRSKRTVS